MVGIMSMNDKCCSIDNNHTHCACCDRIISDNGQEISFCSIECACYSGRYSIREGWINSDKPIQKTTPKMPWYLPEEKHEEHIKTITGK